ncbi:hypothetical protein L3Y34_004198 [Caenorhabditis briggsae]|uniref:BICC1 first type I KH domain-containing protein n=1 Tax=Caenorhabditis briggsae TaxID=6238 RepID=A0AAE9A8E3_CAEBR|nr:hypothetical protein L3Y34_004198 [Caenorhabditis briggsae]
MLREDTVTQLPDGRFEQKIQVDRRKLESMITGRIDNSSQQLPTAESFFANVMTYSNAEVIWPSQLKIGAKTKKDPYVKVIGSIEQIESARTLILNSLQIKVSGIVFIRDVRITRPQESYFIPDSGFREKKLVSDSFSRKKKEQYRI